MQTIMDSNTKERVERNTFLIGKYTDEGAYVMANSGTVTMFDIELLCEEPYIINEDPDILNKRYKSPNSNYAGFTSKQRSNMLPVAYRDTDSYLDKKAELDYYYSNSYIIFQPVLNFERNTETFHKNFIIQDVVEIPRALDLNTNFLVIPKVALDQRLFEKKLRTGEYFELDYFSGDLCVLDYIMCGDNLYFCEGWTFSSNNPTSWKRDVNFPVEVIPVEEKSNRYISKFKNNDSIVFMDDTYIQERDEFMYPLTETEEKKVQKEEKIEEYFVDTNESNNSELLMLNDFRLKVLNSGLCYDYADLVNLHICVKSSPLTILAGMSGTGKTQIALKYAKMIDASEANNRLLFIPISPSYTEPDDILGYLNAQTGKYVPSETGLVDFLLEAQKNLNKMYMVIFDEMNLSQIEYWFSPFISVLEKDADSRKIVLYNDKADFIAEEHYKSTINIGNNVIFIGTVNLDETTKDISDRLLDRSFIINLKKKKFIDFQTEYNTMDGNLGDKNVCDSAMLFNEWRSKEEPIKAFTTQELLFLDELHELIANIDEQKGVSYRVLKHIGMYILNIPKDDENHLLIDRRNAFDLVLKQTVMKKLSGPENKMLNLIGHVNSIESSSLPTNSAIIDLFNKYSEVSEFNECKELLRRKAGELLVYGYTR